MYADALKLSNYRGWIDISVKEIVSLKNSAESIKLHKNMHFPLLGFF